MALTELTVFKIGGQQCVEPVTNSALVSPPTIISAAGISAAQDNSGTITQLSHLARVGIFPIMRKDNLGTTIIFSFGYDNAFAEVTQWPTIAVFGAAQLGTPGERLEALDWRRLRNLNGDLTATLTGAATDFLSPANSLKWTVPNRLTHAFDCQNFNVFLWGVVTEATVNTGDLDNSLFSAQII